MEQANAEDSAVLVGSSPARITALADGIFAVATTILSYASGFVILGTLWIGHHYQFHYIRRSTRALRASCSARRCSSR